ncbi:MAG TPA: SpoIIE family protein phosphatase [Acidobacteriaceae bacterium]
MRKIWLILLMWPLIVLPTSAQDGPAIPTNIPAPSAPAVMVQTTPGQAAVALNGPWKFHTGDNLAWAQPNFDDSNWQDYTIDAKQSALPIAQLLQSPALPGWQRHGHSGYTGYAWYRIRLQRPPDAHSLALLMPQHFDDGYEVYVNGQKIGSLGKLDPVRAVYSERSKLFALPETVFAGHAPVTIAVRFWDSGYQGLPSLHNVTGGLRGVPVLGSSSLLGLFQDGLTAQRGNITWPSWSILLMDGVVGLISLFLFFFSRSQREYLWAGICLLSWAVLLAVQTAGPQRELPLQVWAAIIAIADSIEFFALPLAAMYLLDVPRTIWRRSSWIILVAVVFIQMVALGPAYGILTPTAALDHFNTSALRIFVFAVFALLVAIAVDGLRTLGKKAWLPLAPGLLFVCGVLVAIQKPQAGLWVPGARSDPVGSIFFLATPIVLLLIFLQRFITQQRETARLVDDMKQAQEVQQVLIPEKLPQVPGLSIESEYRPAREVGGDFFQTIPHPTDGSVLIVVGDVTGKGLQAGMLVALIVGVIRTTVETSFNPLEVMQSLNRRLCGRGHAHATCLALRIGADGSATLANAGHLPPYLNGKELPMEGALPLGMMESADFSVMQFQLAPGDRLLLMSDGVAEAQDAKGQLFGFERIEEMLREPVTAAEMAAAAQNFGQEDDISILSVTRMTDLKVIST